LLPNSYIDLQYRLSSRYKKLQEKNIYVKQEQNNYILKISFENEIYK